MPVAEPGVNQERITNLVTDVLSRLNNVPREEPRPRNRPTSPAPAARSGPTRFGVFESVDDAVAAAKDAQRALSRGSLADREAATDCIRRILREDRDELGQMEFDETRIGRLEHKKEKLDLVATVPGVEFLRTEAVSGDHGLSVTEYAPYGVIGVITPVTHSVPTLASNAIMMIAAGNSLVCNPHPAGARCVTEATRRWNRAIHESIGIDNLICIIEKPTLDTANRIFEHPDVNLLCVTGGPGVAKAALQAAKRAVVAGPGNPPVVVDETADIEAAAAGIVRGAAYDNNLLCIGEKEVFVVDAVADALLEALGRHGGYRLSRVQIDRLGETVIHQDPQTGHYVPDKACIGQDAAVLAQALGIDVPDDVRLLYGETDERNPLVPCEQMMPVLPVVRVQDVNEAIEKAVYYEHGFKHTAIMWSRNVANLTRMGQACGATLFVKNGPCMAGLGVGGEGYTSFSTASPTGEGVTNPLSFTRYRRCVMVDYLRIV
jgi:aldehyde dehydrogenase